MRILFLSDTHLGFDLPAARGRRPGGARRRRGQDFFRGYQEALAPAWAGEVDVVLHGGDLLYRSRVPAWLSEAALAPLRALAGAGLPVLLVPGNHERGSLPHPLLAAQSGLHVFDRPRTVVLEKDGLRVAFAGFPYAREVRAGFPALLAATGHSEAPAGAPRLLCLHHCVEGATCGPGDFTFTSGGDVIRRADLPTGFAAVLSGHVHRHQVLRRTARGPPVVYAGSTERTSFAEAGEEKGVVLLRLSAAGLAGLSFRALASGPLPPRPPARRWISDGADAIKPLPARAGAPP